MKLIRLSMTRLRYFFCLMLPLFLFLTSCGSNEPDDHPKTGSISFKLVWQHPSVQSKAGSVGLSPSGDVCEDYAIETIGAAVKNASGKEVASKSWPCSDHQGKITSVPAESNLTLSITGYVAGIGLWRNQGTEIKLTVNANQNTDVGDINLRYFGDDTEPPTIVGHYPDDGATDIDLIPVITVTFNEDMVSASVIQSCRLIEAVTTNQVPCTVEYGLDEPHTATITPNSELSPGSKYTVIIGTGVENKAGINMVSEFTWSFTTVAGQSNSLIWNEGKWDEKNWN